MMEGLAFLTTAGELWRGYVFPAAWQSALVGLILLAVVYSIRRAPAPLRYGLLVLALLKFAIPPLLAIPYSPQTPLPVSDAPMAEEAVRLASMPGHSSTASVIAPAIGNPVPAQTEEALFESRPFASPAVRISPPETSPSAAASAPPLVISNRESIWAILLLFHLMGSLLILLYLGLIMIRTWRFTKACDPVNEPAVLILFDRIRARLGIRRRIRLLSTKTPCGPMAIGALRPRVVIPSPLLASLTPAQLEAVLAHELAHHRRGDLWLLPFEIALLALWWFHPVLWLLRRALRSVREDCCDDLLIVSGISNREAYCTTLLEAAGYSFAPRWAHASLGVAGKYHPLGRRLRRIMDLSTRRTPRLSMTGLALILTLALLILPGFRMVEGSSDAAPIPLGPATTTRVPLFNAIVADGVHYFQLTEEDQQALWRTDGTPEGTWLVHETKGSILFVAGGERLLYFLAEDTEKGYGVYVVHSTDREPQLLALTLHSQPFGIVISGDRCFWYYRLGDEGYLWTSDGTVEGTQEVRRFQYLSGLPSEIDMMINQAKPLAAVPGGVVLGAPHPEAGIELWFSDGTQKGTVLIADLCSRPELPAPMGNMLSSIPSFVPFKGDFAYFRATGPLCENLDATYRTDGTTEGTLPEPFPEIEFTGEFSELFSMEPGGVFRVIEDNQEVARGRIDLSNVELSQRNGFFYFYGDDGIHGWEVWRAGGTPFTVERLTDLNPGPGGIETTWDTWQPPMVVLGNRLLFWGSDGSTGRRLWGIDLD